MDSDKFLLSFMKKITRDLEKNKLTQEQKQKIGEFYMSYILSDSSNSDTVNTEDFLKFFTMGWYVYKQMLKTEK